MIIVLLIALCIASLAIRRWARAHRGVDGPDNRNEDVYGEAAKANRDLAAYKRYNGTWWADPFVPDEWDAVEPIRMNGNSTAEVKP